MPENRLEDNINLRSEEVQEILSNPPIWIVRWGITLIFMFVCIILALSFMIKYPDFVTAKVLVTTKQPTEKVISRYSGQIDKIFIKNRDTVEVNQKLAIIKNTANFKDVYHLKEIMDTLPFKLKSFIFPFQDTSYLILGDISTAYISFEKSYTDYYILKDLDPYNNQLGGNQTSLNEKGDNIRFLKNLTQSYDLLKEAIRDWEYKYVLKSSIHGVVSFQDYWGVHQFVNSGSIVFSILPVDTSSLVGKLVIPAQNAGKVEVGQKVFIKLDNYPYQQYGMLIGKVTNFSISPNDEGNYTVFIDLLNGTNTSYNKTFVFTQELLGNAEIITEDLSVAQRLFYKFREVLTYN